MLVVRDGWLAIQYKRVPNYTNLNIPAVNMSACVWRYDIQFVFEKCDIRSPASIVYITDYDSLNF